LDFFYSLREHGVPATTHNWLAFIDALGRGLHDDSLDGFYRLGRCLLVSGEAHYDGYDQAFLATFKGVAADLAKILGELDDWVRDPARLQTLDPALQAALRALDPDELRRLLEQRLAEQRRRHQGGNRWLGSGGTSPFGQGGMHPSGIRIGSEGGGRSALAVAGERRFAAYRNDRVLDTRQLATALRRLRSMGRDDRTEELDLDETVAATARNCGDLEIRMARARKNDIRVLLLMDVGGSMSPHTRNVERLFSAAHRSGGFRHLEPYYFHNCVYGEVYRDAAFREAVPTSELIAQHEPNWRLIMVGDAYMHPAELMMTSGDFWSGSRGPTGLVWLTRLADRFRKSAWLNPEPRRLWSAPTIAEVGGVFAMFPLTVEGIEQMAAAMRSPHPMGTFAGP
jgi:hypothetical protein